MIIIRKQMVINANSFIFFSYTNDFYFILLKKKKHSPYRYPTKKLKQGIHKNYKFPICLSLSIFS